MDAGRLDVRIADPLTRTSRKYRRLPQRAAVITGSADSPVLPWAPLPEASHQLML